MDEKHRLLSLLKAGPDASLNNVLKQALERNVKHMQLSSKNMEKENLEMERKISALKEKLNKEREEREKFDGELRWRSSGSSNVRRQIEKKTSSKRVLKVLKDESLESYKQPVRSAKTSGFYLCGQCENRRAKVECNECNENYCSLCYKQFHSKGALKKHTWKSLEQSLANSAKNRKSMSPSTVTSERTDCTLNSDADADTNITVHGVPAPTTQKPSLLPSGRVSSLASKPIDHVDLSFTSSWVEDNLQYQSFDKSPTSKSINNQEYLLKKTTSLDSPISVESSLHESNDLTLAITSDHKSLFTTKTSDMCGTSSDSIFSLLHGSYDEEANAAAFRDALNEWRLARVTESPNQLIEVKETHSTSVNTDNQLSMTSPMKQEIKVMFSSESSLSYLDRMMVKKHREDPTFFFDQPKPVREGDENITRDTTIPIVSSSIITPQRNYSHVGLRDFSTLPVKNIETTQIEVTPYSNNDGDENSFESNTDPVISSEDVQTLVHKKQNLFNCVDIVEFDYIKGDANSSYEQRPATSDTRATTTTLKHESNASTGVLKRPKSVNSYNVWRPQPTYISMDDFFMLGVGEDNDSRKLKASEGLVSFNALTNQIQSTFDVLELPLHGSSTSSVNSEKTKNNRPLLTCSSLDYWDPEQSYNVNKSRHTGNCYIFDTCNVDDNNSVSLRSLRKSNRGSKDTPEQSRKIESETINPLEGKAQYEETERDSLDEDD